MSEYKKRYLGPSADDRTNKGRPNKITSFKGEYRWLSNFWLTPVTYQGYVYPSTENAYQAAKSYRFVDGNPFLTCTPAKSKRLSRQRIIRTDWDDVKLDVMRAVLVQKFCPGSYLAAQLVATGAAEIIEGNTWGDIFWGVCDGVGENHLGRLIMEIRSGLISESGS